MANLLSGYLEQLKLAEPAVHGSIAVVPLISPAYDGIEYLTMSEALEMGHIEVTEVSREGSVPDLKVINRGSEHVLLLDGEELRGAKQNRVLNSTILLQGKFDALLPVSCTERGRWNYRSDKFEDSGIMMSRNHRSYKNESVSYSLRESRGHRADQGGIWENIDNLSKEANCSSATSAMRDVYEGRTEDISDYIDRLPSVDGQCGVLVFLAGRLAGLDLVGYPQAYAKLHRKILTSYVMEAILQKKSEVKYQELLDKARSFINEIGTCSEEVFPAAGMGTDYRFKSPKLIGSALMVEQTTIHLAFFRKEGQGTQPREERMSSFSQRRRFRE
ncbi:hypothetical protein OR1_02622 [Geobacter sp. OR-1]|uniref:ARPP-1 family domain-containing protein n=1 Tax=Geobacter sp. OR-1 TaxID=1266765 RepID=UPI0005430067|nr:DUF6569 family protein [Geobacter sp. OR-1]GAM10333.1 hypothetical protein OR1_02622 [Geobacter sp. OR-1]